jgi:hypothetical protein
MQRSPKAMADDASAWRPPSLKLSGVALTMAIRSGAVPGPHANE